MLRALADWWDGVELWFTGLWFPLQVLVAGVVLLPLCWWFAAAADRALDGVIAAVSSRIARRRTGNRG